MPAYGIRQHYLSMRERFMNCQLAHPRERDECSHACCPWVCVHIEWLNSHYGCYCCVWVVEACLNTHSP